MEKCVIDTNVLLDRSFEAIMESFTNPTHIIIPYIVLKEIDKFKTGNEPKNEYARGFIRDLDEIRQLGNLSKEGVFYKEKHLISVDINDQQLDLEKPDYQIIKSARENEAKLITQDINARVVADSVSVEAQNFAPEDIDVNELYTGYSSIRLSDEEAEHVAEIQSFDHATINAGKRRLVDNQFVIMKPSIGGEFEGIYHKENNEIELLQRSYNAFGVKPKKKDNKVVREQKFLMHLLLDPNIDFVSAIGPSGCGKTLLTLACALEQTIYNDTYNKITIMRPLVSASQDIGFLPGDKFEKLEPWMGSTFDALDYLLTDYQTKDRSFSSKEKIYQLMQEGRIELEAMSYLRGRNLPKQFIIVDDAQNATKDEVATIITRAGEGTKVVFLGDLSEKQIDNHRLTPSSNGLAYAIDRFKGESIVGHITLKEVVRSRLAQLGVEKL